MIGGGTVAFTLGTASIFSTELRCSMMLIIPGLFAGRGRAFILTAGMGLLIDGPVDSINTNLEQIVTSVTCMYTHMKSLACRFKTSSAKIFEQVGKILKLVEDNMKERLKEIEKLISRLTGDAQKEFIALKKQVEDDLAGFQKALEPLKDAAKWPQCRLQWSDFSHLCCWRLVHWSWRVNWRLFFLTCLAEERKEALGVASHPWSLT